VKRAPRRRRGRAQRGFSLVEALVAIALLAMLMAAVASSQGDAMFRAAEVMNLTNATQIVETVVLKLEEEYRLDGFPSNRVEGRSCRNVLPRGFERFRCEYDLLMLDAGKDKIDVMGSQAQETLGGSAMMNTFCGPEGGAAAANIAAVCAQLQMGGGTGLPGELAAFAPLCDPGLSLLCGVNLQQMCNNTMMISSFIPIIIEQAAGSTRKLVVRMQWDDEGLVANRLEIETFITATPEAEVRR